MSIYTPYLSSIPFKSELYLARYVKFIEACLDANKSLPSGVYTEEHHVLPKAKTMFPQFIDLRQHPWNAARLTLRQHFIAHLMLKRAYMNAPMCRAVTLMAGKNSRWYEQAKIDLAAALRELLTGKPKSKETRMKMSIALTGRIMSDEAKKKISKSSAGKPKSKETRMKMSKAQQGQNNHNFKGFYQTPFGTFKSSYATSKATAGGISHNAIVAWCKKDNLKIISNKAYSHSKFLQDNYTREDVVGKTFNDLGFSFIQTSEK